MNFVCPSQLRFAVGGRLAQWCDWPHSQLHICYGCMPSCSVCFVCNIRMCGPLLGIGVEALLIPPPHNKLRILSGAANPNKAVQSAWSNWGRDYEWTLRAAGAFQLAIQPLVCLVVVLDQWLFIVNGYWGAPVPGDWAWHSITMVLLVHTWMNILFRDTRCCSHCIFGFLWKMSLRVRFYFHFHIYIYIMYLYLCRFLFPQQAGLSLPWLESAGVCTQRPLYWVHLYKIM